MAWQIELQGGPHDGLQMEISRPVEEILMAVVITPPPPLIAYPIIPAMPPIRLADALYRNAGIIRAGVLIYRHHERPAS